MTAPLLTRDARELRLLMRPRWQRRLLAWTLPVATIGLIVWHVLAVGPEVCTAQDPCRPEPHGTISLGLLLAAAISGFISPRVAAWLAGGFVVALIVSERLLDPRLVSPAWLYLVDVGFVGLCALLGNISRDRRPTAVAQQWLAGVRRERPPVASDLPRPGRVSRSVAWLLWLVATACLIWGWFSQQEASSRERAAERATAEVVAHPDEFSVEIRLGGQTSTVNVYDALNYPVGSRMELYVNDGGLRQPVSEPYDASGWILLAVFLGGTGWLGWARGVEKRNGPRMLLGEKQPVTEVSVLPGADRFVVYAGDARPGEPAILQIRTTPIVIEADGDGEIRANRSLLESRPHPASLYGIPAPGHWCAIVVGGEVVVPTRPISAKKVGAPPYATVVDIPDDDSSTPAATTPTADLSLRAEEVEALRESDRNASPEQVLIHVRSPLSGYLNAASLPLVVMPLARFLPDLAFGALALLAGVVVAGSLWLCWRLFIRGGVAWNAHGVAVVGAFGYKRVPWRMVSGIEHDRRGVTIHTGYSSLGVNAGRVRGVLGRRDRTAEELANALRHARNAARVGGDDTSALWHAVVDTPVVPTALEDLPNLEAPKAPAGLYLLWLVLTPAYAWILQVLS